MTLPDPSRRRLVLGATAAAATTTMLAACATPTAASEKPPIVFVHGNGDTAALWTTTLWRFESNGWPRERLLALELPYPLARDDDRVPQPGRSGTEDQKRALAAAVDRLRAATGARQVVLIANSRGGYAVRQYLATPENAAQVSHAILCGTPNHGVYADPANRTGNEFNGAGPFLRGLNAPQGPDGLEVPAGPKWLTIRSDRADKYAQPDAVWLGAKGLPTHVDFDGPALKGARNVVIDGIDHRETAFSPKAFAAMWRFLTGAPADRHPAAIAPEGEVVLNGSVSGFGVGNREGSAPSNLPLAGAVVEVYAVAAETGERTASKHRQVVGADGAWGPFHAEPGLLYEFVISGVAGYATTHIYRSPFPRSSSVVNLRAERITDPADQGAAAVVTLTRPRGYFGVPRDEVTLDGHDPAPGIPPGTPGISAAKVHLTTVAEVGRAVTGSFNGERLTGRAWPIARQELTFLELTY